MGPSGKGVGQDTWELFSSTGRNYFERIVADRVMSLKLGSRFYACSLTGFSLHLQTVYIPLFIPLTMFYFI